MCVMPTLKLPKGWQVEAGLRLQTWIPSRSGRPAIEAEGEAGHLCLHQRPFPMDTSGPWVPCTLYGAVPCLLGSRVVQPQAAPERESEPSVDLHCSNVKQIEAI